MIIVAGEVVLEEGQLDAARDALEKMVRATRAEPGCLAYGFATDVLDPSILRIFERWESEEALAAHFAAPHMATFLQALAAVEPRSMEVKAFAASGEVPLPG
jgi:quinol monooxygenase YgiN